MKITVAEILTTHGIKGNLKIKSYSDNEKRFEKGSKLNCVVTSALRPSICFLMSV